MVDLGYDASFKLTQSNIDDTIKKYIDITGYSSSESKEIMRSFVEIETIFEREKYPETIPDKEVKFVLDSSLGQGVLSKFA